MDAEYKQCLGRVLKSHRLANGLTMQKVCLMCDLDRLTLRKIENGTGNPTLNILIRLAEGLGISFAQAAVEAGEMAGIARKANVKNKDAYYFTNNF